MIIQEYYKKYKLLLLKKKNDKIIKQFIDSDRIQFELYKQRKQINLTTNRRVNQLRLYLKVATSKNINFYKHKLNLIGFNHNV